MWNALLVVAWLALAPIGLALFLLVGLRLPATKAMPACALLTAAVSGSVWKVSVTVIGAALVESLFITASILLILFGAVWLMEQLTELGALAGLREWLASQFRHQLIAAVIVAWLLGSFFEGAAGFGAPAVITAPLLVALEFPPLAAVVAALIGDSVAVSFGAVGTPFLVGMAQALPREGGLSLEEVARTLVLYDLYIGPVMPVLMVWTLGLGFRGRAAFGACWAATPFAFAVGASHLAVTAICVHQLGLELPSLLGPLAGLAVAFALLRLRWLVPGAEFRLAPKVSRTRAVQDGTKPGPVAALPPFAAAIPYAVLVAVLVLTRLPATGLGPVARSLAIDYPGILGTSISARVEPLYSPFAAFALVALLAPCLLQPWTRKASLAKAAGEPVSVHGKLVGSRVLLATRRSAKRGIERVSTALIPLAASVAMVRVFIHTGAGASGLPAMPEAVAALLAQGLGSFWVWLAPWLGALGAFISGSATFSNLLFSGIQQRVAVDQGLPPVSILALQSMGSAAGNMVCVHNVVAAAAVVGLVGQESAVLRRTALPLAAYLVLGGLVGWVHAACD